MNWICVVCGSKMNRTYKCSCGFDETKYYERYMSLARIDSGLTSAYKKRKNHDNAQIEKIRREINQEADRKIEQEVKKRVAVEVDKAVKTAENDRERQRFIDSLNKVKESKQTANPTGNTTTVPTADSNGKSNYERGVALYNGVGVPKDYSKAFAQFKIAAEAGNDAAMNYLGDMYYFGDGVSKNMDSAKEWYTKAATKGNEKAINNLSKRFGTTINNKYQSTLTNNNVNISGTPGTGAASASKPNTSATNSFPAYDEIKPGHKLWQKYQNAKSGNMSAMADLGDAFRMGNDVKQDYKTAMEWYRKATDKGSSYSMGCIGYMYEMGQGVPKSMDEAISWYKKSSASGFVWAMNRLGDIYSTQTLKGTWNQKNYKEAAVWYQKAADKGNADAMNKLGNMYYFGDGVIKNMDSAKHWYTKAAEKGNTEAKDHLKKRFGISK